MSVWLRAAPARGPWSAGRGSRRPACGGPGTPSRSPGARAARALPRSAARGASASASIAASRRSSRRRAAQARSATSGESQVRRSLPSPQVDSRSGRSSGSWRSRASGRVTSRTPRSGTRRRTASSQIGPSDHQWPEQLGVDREGDEAGLAALVAEGREAARPRRRRTSLRGSRRERAPPRGRTGPRRSTRGAFPPSTDDGTRRRPDRTGSRPATRRARTASQSSVKATSSSRGPHRRQGVERALVAALVGAEEPQAALGEQRLDSGAVGALGKPEALGGAEAAPVRAKAGVDLKAPAGGGGDQRQHRVGGRGWHQRHVSLGRGGAEGREHVAAEVLQAAQGAAIALGLGLGRRAQLGQRPRVASRSAASSR